MNPADLLYVHFRVLYLISYTSYMPNVITFRNVLAFVYRFCSTQTNAEKDGKNSQRRNELILTGETKREKRKRERDYVTYQYYTLQFSQRLDEHVFSRITSEYSIGDHICFKCIQMHTRAHTGNQYPQNPSRIFFFFFFSTLNHYTHYTS